MKRKIFPLNTSIKQIETEINFLKNNNMKFMYWIGKDKHHKIELINN